MFKVTVADNEKLEGQFEVGSEYLCIGRLQEDYVLVDEDNKVHVVCGTQVKHDPYELLR